MLAKIHSRRFEPPVPELLQRADGLRERVWQVKMKGRALRAGDSFSLELRAWALQGYRRTLLDQGAADDDGSGALLDVRVEIAAPRSFKVAIARGGAAPDWDLAADTWVMHALEAVAGPIAQWEGVPRTLWGDWPLPPS